MISHGYLVHHGILGQKWGVRRYQNADGSLTEAGKKRYYDSNGRLTKEGFESDYWKNKRNKMWDRGSEIGSEYDKTEGKKTHDELMKTLNKYEDSYDDDKWWDEFYEKFDAHEKPRAYYIGKKLVEEFGETEVDNYNNLFGSVYTQNYKAKGKTIVDQYVDRFQADYDKYF